MDVEFEDTEEFEAAYDDWCWSCLPELGCLGSTTPKQAFFESEEYARAKLSWAASTLTQKIVGKKI